MSLDHMPAEDDRRLYRENISLLEEQVINRFPDAYERPEILRAIRTVPRHLFVHPDYRYLAYTDNAFPTKHGLTTSAPSVIAEFIRQSGAARGARVLEIGTGTGYEAALLSEMGAHVVSVEADRAVARESERVLGLLGYVEGGRIELRTGNGRSGAPDRAPFHAVIVAAAARKTEDLTQLLRQLRDGGRLVAPIGPREGQMLHIFERRGGRVSDSVLEKVSFSFVPLV